MTSPNRVDAASQFLGELRTQASKGFDGSISLSGNGNEVRVYLRKGDVYAIHSPQFTFPTAELAVAYTGVEPTGSDHLRWLYERALDSPNGDVFALGHLNEDGSKRSEAALDRIDHIVRDWSYGLLASALTWRNTRVRRHKRDEVDTVRFYETPWQVVLADVTARVDELVSSWAIITDYLAANSTEAREPRPASIACQKLALVVDDNHLLRYAKPIDEVARHLGTTRYAVVAAAAREILNGRHPQVAVILERTPDAVTYPVPESLEDPAHEWASVAAAAEVDRSELTPAQDAEPDPVVDEEDLALPEPEHEQDQTSDDADPSGDFGYGDMLQEVGGYAEEPQATQDADASADPAPRREEIDNPLEGGVEVSSSTALARPQDLDASGATQLRTWVESSADERERSVRDRVRHQAVLAAHSSAQELIAALKVEIVRLEVAADETLRTAADVTGAEDAEQQAQGQVAAADVEVQRIEDEGAALRSTEAGARSEVERAAAATEGAQEDVAEAERVLAAAKEALLSARTREVEAQGLLEQAARVLDEEYLRPLAAATAARDDLVTTALEPARQRVAAALAAAAAAHEGAADLFGDVMSVGYDAELGVRVVKDLDDAGELNGDLLVAELRDLHERVTAVIDKVPSLAAEDADADGHHEVDAVQVDVVEHATDAVAAQHDVVDGEVVDEPAADPLPNGHVDFGALGLTGQTAYDGYDSAELADPADSDVRAPAPDAQTQASSYFDEVAGSFESDVPAAQQGETDSAFSGLSEDAFGMDSAESEEADTEASWDSGLDEFASSLSQGSPVDSAADEWDLGLSLQPQEERAGALATFDEVMSDAMPKTEWDGSTAQWGPVQG